ncbi:SDR family NAD(P)-dependent oxidoreductase [Hyphomicrobium sp.]|uniref:SDR family NAD(P)-dependent oxidoreductase n=1 Tax=Hyphomicrobium sp. TaxID=82 RepID=UPI0025C5E745|nr:SDR family NAD(P)-dependent oxidoreductase [Hyphomicrobium sp.]MCC7252735.1 SDR family NAD(P)-dependent oxidoreductase [Hyphomicrobium sp.]
MTHPLFSLADLWIGRSATPSAQALEAVSGVAPAVVVTGGSRGIGRAIAARFARAGRDLVLIARERAPLEAAAEEIARQAGVRAVPLALDVSLPDAPQQLDTALREARLYADVLVNNAGVGLAGPFTDPPLPELERLITLNITAASRLMHHVLPAMLARARGGILNIGSLGGLVPGPYQAAYYASKAYLVSLTEAVAYEVRGRGVRIAVVAPGPVDTTFHRAMHAENALYRTIIPALSADAVARSAYRGFMIGRTVIVPGVLPSLGALGVKLLPHAISVPLVGALLAVGNGRPSGSDPL